MGKETAISWAESTFNIAWGCQKVSDGCANCYADELSSRTYGKGLWGPGSDRRTFGEKYWNKLYTWDEEAKKEGLRNKVFCSSMCDVFDDHPTINHERKKLWRYIDECQNLDFLLLTKRPQNINRMLPQSWLREFEGKSVLTKENIWLGTSVEDMRVAHRIKELVHTVAQVNFISYEPALGPIHEADLDGIDWVIYGGESGPAFRKDNTQWARDIRRVCDEKNIPFFYKQGSNRYTEVKILLDGEKVQELPRDRTGAWHPKLMA
jgi:protein gp37